MSRGRRALVAVVLAASSIGLLSACSDETEHADHESTTSTSAASPVTRDGKDTTTSSMAGEHAHATTTTAFPRARASDRISIELVDHSFVGMPATVTGPRVFLVGVNKGPSDHEMVVTDQDGTVVAGVPPFPKGQTRELAVEISPGTYTIQCLVKQGSQTHAELGMKNTFAVS